MRQESKFKLVPYASLATVEALEEPARPPRVGGDPVPAVRIRGAFSAAARPGGSSRPREGPRRTPEEGGAAGTPAAHSPQPLSLDVAPLQQGGWAGSLSGSFY